MTVQRARRGFTIVELVLVLAILSVIAGIALPRYGAAEARYRVKAAARRVVSDIHYARSVARASSTTVMLEFKVSTDGYYTLSHGALVDGGADNKVHLCNEPYKVAIAKADFGSDPGLVFDGFGGTGGGEIVIASGGWAATIVVDGATGEVTVIDP